ncbi:MAG: hypothetical protein ACK53Q_07510 [Dolichospermum sp.]
MTHLHIQENQAKLMERRSLSQKQKVIAIADNFIQLIAFFTREIFNQYGLTIV